MGTLNRDAGRAARAAGVHALTDVTGFGLLGHLHEMALASGCGAVVHSAAVPAIEGATFEPRTIAGGTRRNRAFAETFATFGDDVAEERRWLVCDAMTSGGLLAAGPRPAAGVVIGRLVEGPPGAILVG
jgi:selenide,water dikinase